MDLLAAEITARTGKDPGEHYRELTAEFGTPYYTRIDAPATPEQKARLEKLSPEAVTASTLAGEPITAKLTRAPGNNAPIGGLEGRDRQRLVRGPAVRHREHLQDLRGELPGRGAPGRHRQRGAEIVSHALGDGVTEPRVALIERSGLATPAPRLEAGMTSNTNMKPTEMLHDLGQSLWLDNITRDLLDSGTLQRYIDELSVTGLTSNPTIFDHAIKNSTAYDAAIRDKLAAGQVRRGAVLRAGARGPDAGRRPVPADPRPDQRRRRLGVARGVAAAGLRHGEHARRGQGAARAGGAAEPLHQDPRHQGGPARHRGGDLRRRADQRDAALLARAVPGGGRGVSCAASSGASPPASTRRRLGRLAVRQPLGRRGRGQGARRAAQPARHRHRQAHLQGVPRAARLAPLAARLQRRRPAAAAAVGQHRHQGSRRPPTSSTSRRSPRRSRSTPCPRRR